MRSITYPGLLVTHKKSLITLLFLTGIGLASASAQSNIEGDWKDARNGAIISIYEENGKYYGQLKGSEDPEAQKRIDTHEKILLLQDFEKENETSFCCGTIYQPQKKRTISATLHLEDKNTLRIEGRYGPFRGTEVWTKI